MAFRPDSNHPATLIRRDALLDAAIGLIGDQGPRAITHRAIAAKAGLPPATTSYFFATIDDLLVAAMRRVTSTITEQIQETTERAAALRLPRDETIRLFVDVLLAEPEAATIAQFETYLEAARRPELRSEVEGVLEALEELAMVAMRGIGAPVPRHAAQAVVALVDGFALQRLGARRDIGHAAALRDALLTLLKGYDSYT